MRVAPRLGWRTLCVAVGLTVMPPEGLAQAEEAPRPALTIETVREFLTAAGLQTCEASEIDPSETYFPGVRVSLSIGVAVDCGAYDPLNPTVVNVHQFVDEESRDAMVSSLQNLRFRALRAYGDVWAVDDFVIVLLGPQRQEVGALIKAEYRRRHPEEG
jgi:hypothetical protein